MATKTDGTDGTTENQAEEAQGAVGEATVALQMTPELLEELERRAKAHTEQKSGQGKASAATPEAAPPSSSDEEEDDDDQATAMLQMTPELLAKLREEGPGDPEGTRAESDSEPEAAVAEAPEEPVVDVAFDTSELETLRDQSAASLPEDMESVESYALDVSGEAPSQPELEEEATRMAEAVDLGEAPSEVEVEEEATMMASAEDVAAAVLAATRVDSEPGAMAIPTAEPVFESVPPPSKLAPTVKAAPPSAGVPRSWLIGGAVAIAVILLVLFLPFSDPFGLYGDGEEDAKAKGDGSSVPISTQNQGTSVSGIARSHLPGGFDVYVGVSTSGILNASLLDSLLDENEQDALISELENKAGEIKTALDAGEASVDDIEALALAYGGDRGVYGSLQFSSEVDLEAIDGAIGDMDGVTTKKWGEVEQVYVHDAMRAAVFTEDNGVLVGGQLSTVQSVLEGDDDEHPGNFLQDENIKAVAAHLDLDATAWAIAAPEDLFGMIPPSDGSAYGSLVPDDVREGLIGAGIAVHMDKDIFIQVAFLFEETDQADAVWIMLEALKENEVADKDGHGHGQLQKLLDESEKGSDMEKMIQLVHADLYRAKFKVKGDVLTIALRLNGELVKKVKETFMAGNG